MDTPTVPETNAVYRERLQQAMRVMQELKANPGDRRFNIETYATMDESGTIVGCIAGFCGLDPWFQERGFFMELGKVAPSVFPNEFFGTEEPFYLSRYGTHDPARVTIDDAINALTRAIAALPPKILRVSIGPMPQELGDPVPKVQAFFDDGTDSVLFEFYPDEISFSETDFVGLTASEAMTLRHRKDVAFLQS